MQKTLYSDLVNYLEKYNIHLKSDDKKYYGVCPLHDNADNPSGFVLYKNSGVWRCFTHKCHEIYGDNIGSLFVALEQKYQINIPNKPVCFRNKVFHSEKIDTIRQSNIWKQHKNYSWLLDNIIIPSPYFLKRGFTSKILCKYQVGQFKPINNDLSHYTIIPIYDILCQKIIGYSARVEFPLCLVCNTYHPLNKKCPDQQHRYFHKWKHSPGLNTSKILYNYCFAQKYVLKTQIVIITESPGNVWRLEEANIHNSVAIFGCNLSRTHIYLLKILQPQKIILLFDNDEAGYIARQKAQKLLKNNKIISIDIPYNDIGDMSIIEVQNLLKPCLKI